jgi:hypothetical protein
MRKQDVLSHIRSASVSASESIEIRSMGVATNAWNLAGDGRPRGTAGLT